MSESGRERSDVPFFASRVFVSTGIDRPNWWDSKFLRFQVRLSAEPIDVSSTPAGALQPACDACATHVRRMHMPLKSELIPDLPSHPDDFETLEVLRNAGLDPEKADGVMGAPAWIVDTMRRTLKNETTNMEHRT